MLLLAGLFLLIYVVVFAGALLAEVLLRSDAPRRLVSARPRRAIW